MMANVAGWVPRYGDVEDGGRCGGCLVSAGADRTRLEFLAAQLRYIPKLPPPSMRWPSTTKGACLA